MVGEIPQSDLLKEESGDTISELLSRDPEGLTSQDRAKVVAALREQRAKWEAAEAAGASQPKAKKVAAAAASLIAKINPEDIGL